MTTTRRRAPATATRAAVAASAETMQGTINYTVGYLLQTLSPLPARDDTIEARIEAELERVRIVEATVKRWWGLS